MGKKKGRASGKDVPSGGCGVHLGAATVAVPGNLRFPCLRWNGLGITGPAAHFWQLHQSRPSLLPSVHHASPTWRLLVGPVGGRPELTSA
jgi:hypothetical protein